MQGLIEQLRRMYVDRVNIYREHPELSTSVASQAKAFIQGVSELLGTQPQVTLPQNMNNYTQSRWCLTPNWSPDQTDLDLDRLAKTEGGVWYLDAQICPFSPTLNAVWVWIQFREEFQQTVYPLLDDIPHQPHDTETLALGILEAAEMAGLDVPGWAFMRQPAPSDWPRQFWMPEVPELRNYLFSGFFYD